jgi:hypothetical protein
VVQSIPRTPRKRAAPSSYQLAKGSSSQGVLPHTALWLTIEPSGAGESLDAVKTRQADESDEDGSREFREHLATVEMLMLEASSW